ncbi:hypothetical protein DL771_007653 [Monosporascus sp. 5C6A]|nr:hypothetical protein DL771_007653 [Monosporascus sp. 5C6A]
MGKTSSFETPPPSPLELQGLVRLQREESQRKRANHHQPRPSPPPLPPPPPPPPGPARNARRDDGAARKLAWRQARQDKAAPTDNDTASAAALRERNARDGTDNLGAIYREAAAGAVTICFFCGAAIERAARLGCDDMACVYGNRIKYSSGDGGESTAPWFAQHGGPEQAVQKFAPQWDPRRSRDGKKAGAEGQGQGARREIRRSGHYKADDGLGRRRQRAGHRVSLFWLAA